MRRSVRNRRRIVRRTASVIAPAGGRGGRSSGTHSIVLTGSVGMGWENSFPTNRNLAGSAVLSVPVAPRRVENAA